MCEPYTFTNCNHGVVTQEFGTMRPGYNELRPVCIRFAEKLLYISDCMVCTKCDDHTQRRQELKI